MHVHQQAGRQASRQAGNQANRWTDRQTYRQTDIQTDTQQLWLLYVLTRHLTIERISVLNEGFLTLGVGGLVGLSQIPPGLLSNLSLLKGLCKGSHRHVLPFALAPVVLLHQNRQN